MKDFAPKNRDLPRRYQYKFTMAPDFFGWRLEWSLVGMRGGLHLHVTDYGEKREKHFDERYSAGLEYHHRAPPDYMHDQPPSHQECWLLKQPCWHDGTSLYAMERYVPLLRHGCHLMMFTYLISDADDKFNADKMAEEEA